MKGALASLAVLVVAACLPSVAAEVVAGNGVYVVKAVDSGASGLGTWAAGTGLSFGTASQNDKAILYDFHDPARKGGTVMVKSYATGTVYGQAHIGGATGGSGVPLDGFHTSTVALGTNGIRNTWTITGGDALGITEDLVADATSSPATASNSYIRIRIEVCNQGPSSTSIGIRSGWDLLINSDDGAYKAFAATATSSLSFNNAHATVTNPSMLAFATGDYMPPNAPPSPPNTFYVYGLINDPGNALLPAPVDAPDRFQYWDVSEVPLAWDTNPGSGAVTDSVALYYWGYGTPIALAPSGSPGACHEVNTYITLDLASVAPPPPPVASFSVGPVASCAPATVTFTDTSTVPSGPGTSTWDFGDGSPLAVYSPPSSSVTHTFSSFGAFTVTLTVTDADGLQASTSHLVNICAPPNPPVASFTFLAMGTCGDAGGFVEFFDASSDPDGDIVSRSWLFGDGASASGSPVFHAFGDAGGAFDVTLRVLDSTGLEDVLTQAVPVVPYAECSMAAADSQADAGGGAVAPVDGRDMALALADDDHDGVPAWLDACPAVADSGNADTDGDGLGDACDEPTPASWAASCSSSDAPCVAPTCEACIESDGAVHLSALVRTQGEGLAPTSVHHSAPLPWLLAAGLVVAGLVVFASVRRHALR